MEFQGNVGVGTDFLSIGSRQNGEFPSGGRDELRRAAALIARDKLFLSLQGDSNSCSFAEDRVFEILCCNLPPPFPRVAGMSDMLNNALRAENVKLMDQIAERDEKIAFVTRRFETFKSEMKVSKQEEYLTQVIRDGELQKMKEMIVRLKDTLIASDTEALQMKLRFESMMAENVDLNRCVEDLRLAVKDAEKKGSDARLEQSIRQLRDELAMEMTSAKEHQNTLGELIMQKDLQIKDLEEYKWSAGERIEQLQMNDSDMRSQLKALEVHNKSLVKQVEALEVRLAAAAELETLTDEIRHTVQTKEALCEQLDLEKERNLNLELETKDLKHKTDTLTASLQQARDVHGLSQEIRDLMDGTRDKDKDLIAEKEECLALKVENARLCKEIELLREQVQDQKKLENLYSEINNLGHHFDNERSMASDLLHAHKRCSELEVENVALQREVEMLTLKLEQCEQVNDIAAAIRKNLNETSQVAQELLYEKEKSGLLEEQNKMLQDKITTSHTHDTVQKLTVDTMSEKGDFGSLEDFRLASTRRYGSRNFEQEGEFAYSSQGNMSSMSPSRGVDVSLVSPLERSSKKGYATDISRKSLAKSQGNSPIRLPGASINEAKSCDSPSLRNLGAGRGIYIPADVTKDVEGYINLRREIQRLKRELINSKSKSVSTLTSPVKSTTKSSILHRSSPKQAMLTPGRLGEGEVRTSLQSSLSAADVLRRRKQAFGLNKSKAK